MLTKQQYSVIQFPHSLTRNQNLFLFITLIAYQLLVFQTESRKMVTLEQVLENFDSNDDSEMKRITAVITDLLVSYSGAIYISFVSKFYTCNGKGYIHMFKMICNGMCKGGSRSFFRQGFKKRNFFILFFYQRVKSNQQHVLHIQFAWS